MLVVVGEPVEVVVQRVQPGDLVVTADIPLAAEAIAWAAANALATADDSATVAVLSMAGEQTDAFRAEVTERLAAYGVERVVLDHDLLALFCSGTPSPDGYALIAGTGTGIHSSAGRSA